MAKSLVRLDIESKEYEQKLRKSKKQFEDFTASIGINMKKMTAYGVAAGAASAAINKLTESIKQCVADSIEMAKQGEGVRKAFERLNRPDLLDKLREATHNTVTDLELMKQAVKFKDFRLDLDQLGSMLAFAQQKAQDTGQSVDFLVESIVNGLGRQSKLILDNLGISASEIDEEMKKTGDMTQAVANIIKKQMAEAGEHISTAAERAKQADTDLKNSMEDLGRTLMPLVETGEGVFASIETGAINALNNGVGPLVPVLVSLKETLGDIYGSVSESSIWETYTTAMKKVAIAAMNMMGPLGKVVSMLRYIRGDSALEDGAKAGGAVGRAVAGHNGGKTTTKTTGGGGGGGGKTTKPKIDIPTYAPDSIAAQEAEVSALTKKWKEAGEGVRDYYAVELFNAQQKLEKMKADQQTITDNLAGKYTGGLGPVSTSGVSFADKSYLDVGAGIDPAKLKNLREIKKDGDDAAKAWVSAQSAISSVGAAMASIEDPTAKMIGIVAQAIASVALGFADSMAKDQTSKSNIWAFIASAAAATAAMVSTIATIHSATGYAQGGVIPGNSYSGDNQWARVNAGETILTRAQAGNLASQLMENGRQATMQPYVEGENVYLGMNNFTKRSGQGEIVTTGMLRRMGIM